MLNNFGRKLEVFVIVVIIAVIGIIYAFRQKPALHLAQNDNSQQTQNTQTQSDQTAQSDQTQQSTGPSTQTSVKPDDSYVTPAEETPQTKIQYQGVDGKNALDLLRAQHRVEYKHYSYGDMVIGIDGIVPDAKHFWAFYVNDKFSQIGAGSYVTKSSDTIKWEIDAVVDTTK